MGDDLNNLKKDEHEEDLSNFRAQWQKEISCQKNQKNEHLKKDGNSTVVEHNVKPSSILESKGTDDLNEKATRLFFKGSEMENSGKLYEAIQYYRQAVQIVPDIEFIINKKVNPRLRQEDYVVQDIQENVDRMSSNEDDDDDDDDECNKDEDIFVRIQRKASKKGSLCLPKHSKNGLHIGKMPIEIILYILKWVVSDQLDLRSLEMFSAVCRGFYLCARDQEIWRMACLRTWGVNCGSTPGNFKNWRNMFIERSRVNFNGCYISKTTYIRSGENSFQDQFYRPWYLVAYYRYLRFYPDGTVLMLTSAEEPLHSLNLLKVKNPRSPVLTGYYRLKEDKVMLVVKRQTKNPSQEVFKRSRKQESMKKTEQIYNMEFQIRSKRRKHELLHWTQYSIATKTKKGDETVCNFDLYGNRYPPLVFSRVKSYSECSEYPLI